MEVTTTLYRTDFYAWTKKQAALLQAEEFKNLDLPNLVDELEAMGNSQRNEVTSQLKFLLMHLLKWQFQADHRSRSWRNTINVQRWDLEAVLEDNPRSTARIAGMHYQSVSACPP